MGNLTFQQIFRYALAGGITLLVVLGVYFPPGSESDGQVDVTSLGDAALVSAVALVVGGLLYTLHRAIAYPLIYRVLLLFGPLRLDPAIKRAWNIFWPSDEERDRDIARWKQRNTQGSAASNLSEWATQIHYLYCSGWGILVGHLVGWLLGWQTHSSLCRLSVWLVLIVFVAGIYHHVRYLAFESKVLKV